MWRLENEFEAAARISRLYGFGGRAKIILHKLFSFRIDNYDNEEHHLLLFHDHCEWMVTKRDSLKCE